MLTATKTSYPLRAMNPRFYTDNRGPLLALAGICLTMAVFLIVIA